MKSMCPLHSLPHTPVTRSLLFFFHEQTAALSLLYGDLSVETTHALTTTHNIQYMPPSISPSPFFSPWCLCVSFYLVDNERRRSWCSHSHRRSWKKKPFFYSLSNFYLRLSFLRVSVRCCCSLMQQPTSKLKHKKNEKNKNKKGRRQTEKRAGTPSWPRHHQAKEKKPPSF